MTTNNLSNAHAPPISAAAVRVSPDDIERVDAFARKLYKRARAADPDLEEIATTVRSLHTVLKHLKFEAEDPESLLSVDDSAVYARQLTPILEDSEFALKQLDTLLEKKYGGSNAGSDGDGAAQMDGEKGWTMLESRDRDMIELIRTKLSNQKLSIDMFLDTIQLHNPSKSHHMVDTSSASLDSIKDKVDAIATRICQRKNSNLADGNEEELWAQFRDSLEQEGFSRDVLRKNQVRPPSSPLFILFFPKIAPIQYHGVDTLHALGRHPSLHSPVRRTAQRQRRQHALGAGAAGALPSIPIPGRGAAGWAWAWAARPANRSVPNLPYIGRGSERGRNKLSQHRR